MADVDMDLLYDAAVMAAAVRAMYARVKTVQSAKYFTYVLLLQHGKIYVGNTDNIYARLRDHFYGESSKWVREWGPVERVVEIIRNSGPDDERYKYSEYADKFGWANVRGAGWCKVLMASAPSVVRNFSRKADDFDYLTRAEIDDILDKIKRI